MPSMDIRDVSADQIDSIIFAEELDKDGESQGYLIHKYTGDISISDGADCILINSSEHAYNLIKALSKAIELGWLKQ